MIFDSWTFDGNTDVPTFNPSVRITGKKCVVDQNGEWHGEWVRDSNGNAVDQCCHYFLRAGKLEFCSDCTHELSGKTVDLPELPEYHRDPK